MIPLIAAGVSLIPSIYKTISGISQRNKANKMNPIDPGYQVNTGVIDNARILSERAGNYQIPGYGQAVDNINNASSAAFASGVQGASSGGDVLDLATKIAYGGGKRLNDLAVANAEGADQALLQSLEANAASGQEYQNANAYDREMYDRQLREKAALLQGGNENIYGGLDAASSVAQTLINPTSGTDTGGKGFTPKQKSSFNTFRARQKMAGV